jgi:hypothetical protein
VIESPPDCAYCGAPAGYPAAGPCPQHPLTSYETIMDMRTAPIRLNAETTRRYLAAKERRVAPSATPLPLDEASS